MVRNVVFFTAALFSITNFAHANDSLQTISLMTYNINAEKRSTLSAYSDIAEVIKTISPDICGLQKVDSCNSRNPGDVATWLGQSTQKQGIYTPAIKNYEGSTGSYGIALLTNRTPLTVNRLSIPHTDQEQDRAALSVDLDVNSVKVRILVTHLAHESATYRTAQATRILAWIDSLDSGKPVPTILLGDFNAKPAETSMQKLTDAGFVFVKTSGGMILDTSTGQSINHILYRPASAWSLIDAGNPAFGASNRNPVWAKLKVLLPASANGGFQPHSLRSSAIRITRQQLNLHLDKTMKVTCTMYTPSGMLVSHIINSQYLTEGEHLIDMNNDNIATGLYHVVVTIGREAYTYPYITTE